MSARGAETSAALAGSASSNARSAGVDVEISGCAAVLAGGVCELPSDGSLRVWVHAAPADAAFVIPNGVVTVSSSTAIQDGTLHHIVVPGGARELRVTASSNGRARVVRLAPKSAPEWLERARTLRQKGDPSGALALADASNGGGARDGGADAESPADRAFAQGLRGRIDLAAGRTESSFALLGDAARLHREGGRISDAADDSFALAFALNQRSFRYADARRVLDEVHAIAAEYPDGRVREVYYRGTLATETGDARLALLLLRDAREHAARLGLAVLERNATNAYALQLQLVGRVEEARALLEELEKQVLSSNDVAACERMEVAINIGFGALLANEQRAEESPLVDADAPLQRALALAGGGGCADRYLRSATLGNLTLAALQRDLCTRAPRRGSRRRPA